MTIGKSLYLVFGCTALGTLFGGGLGYTLGRLFPDYYRTVFRRMTDGPFDPVSMGVGQGSTFGCFGGMFVGLVLVALFVLRESKVRVVMNTDAMERWRYQ